ncbi:hypothetical protein D3C81_697950 [compost metagenome]
MVDPLDFQQVQGLPDVFGWAFFASMGDSDQAFAARTVEDALELARRVAFLRAVQAHGDECVAEGQGLIEGLLCFLFAEVAQETQDQPAADAQLFTTMPKRQADAIEHYLERDATIGVGLRVEERLGVNDVLRLAALQVGPGQVIEVLFGAQHVCAPVIEIEELLQVVEGIGAAQGLYIVPGQSDLVALGQGEQQLGLQ